MSTDPEDIEPFAGGLPELTPLGNRIELRRLERRMSKRILAQRAGISRQQLWRVMTGKSELTSSLSARLSEALEIDSRVLRDAIARSTRTRNDDEPTDDLFFDTLEQYVASSAGLERTFGTLPNSDDGRRLKRVLLDAIEDIAIARSLKLPREIFDLRRAVVNDDD